MLDIILNNFHVFVLVSTLVYYILLRLYKRSVLLQLQKKDTQESSNLIYVLFVPVLLYLTRFIFLKSQIISNNYYGGSHQPMQIQNQSSYNDPLPKVDKYLKSSYPESTVSSASITI